MTLDPAPRNRTAPGSPGGAGRFAQATLFAYSGVEVVALLTSLVTLLRWGRRRVELASRDPFFADGWDFGLSLAFFGIVVICGIAWLIWQHQAHANLARMQATRFRPAAVWLYLVPILSLFLPYQAVAELARAGNDRRSLRRRWWALYLTANLLLGIGSFLALQDQGLAATITRGLAAAVGIGAAISGIRLITLINAGLESKREEAGWLRGPAALSTGLGAISTAGAAVLTTIGGLSFGFILPELIRNLPDAPTTNMSYAVGTCFNETDNRYSQMSCEEPHQGEIYRVLDHPDAASYPGESLIVQWAEPQCYSRFESYTGVAYQESSLEFGYLYPSLQGWNGGDREVVCYLFDPSGSDLTGPIAPPAADVRPAKAPL